jgi:polar amino acid transport system substrate-binding protein
MNRNPHSVHRMTRRVLLRWAAAWLCGAVLLPPSIVQARSLSEIKGRGMIALCANPDALPYSNKNGEPPGFQLEVARELARGLGVELDIGWIGPAWKADRVNCDFFLDAFNDRTLHEGKLRLSKPYMKTGVALALRDATAEVLTFKDVKAGNKIGVMVGSLAQTLLGQNGVSTSPYAFESDMVEDVARGELYGGASSPAAIAWWNVQHPDRKLRLVTAYDGEPQLAWTVSVGMRKADDALVAAVDEVMERLAAQGVLKTIYAKYGLELRAP